MAKKTIEVKTKDLEIISRMISGRDNATIAKKLDKSASHVEKLGYGLSIPDKRELNEMITFAMKKAIKSEAYFAKSFRDLEQMKKTYL